MIIQYNEILFETIYNKISTNLKDLEVTTLLNNINNLNFKNSLKIIEESIQKESFLGDYKNKNKKYKKNYNKRNYPPRPRKETFLNKDNGKTDKIKKEINGSLNKMSNTNSKTIFLVILKLFEENIDIFDYENFVNTLFDKAVMQPTYCPIYVKLFIIMNRKHNSIDKENQDKFCNLLISKCELFKKMIEEISKTEDDVLNPDNYDDFCQKNKQKVFKKGFAQFIGELHKNNFLTNEFLGEYLLALSKNIVFNLSNKNTNIENSSICLIQLIKTTMNKRQFYKNLVYQKIKDIISYKIMPKKIKFLFMDLLEDE